MNKSHMFRTLLLYVAICPLFCSGQTVMLPQEAGTSRSPTISAAPPNRQDDTVKAAQEGKTDSKDWVDIAGFIVAAASFVLAAIVLVVGVITALGGTMVWKAWQERQALRTHLGELKDAKGSCLEEICKQQVAVIEMIERTALGATRVRSAKIRLEKLLNDSDSQANAVYREIQRTVSYPDLECLQLYVKALERFEKNLDIVRVVRNGVFAFARHR